MWYWLCRKPAKIVDREWGRGRLSVRDSVRELYATEDCNLSFLGLRHLCALQAFSPGIFGGRISELWAGLLSRCLPSHRSSTMSASRQHWAMHLQLPIPPPTRGPHAYPCSRNEASGAQEQNSAFHLGPGSGLHLILRCQLDLFFQEPLTWSGSSSFIWRPQSRPRSRPWSKHWM
jgi:hypothetical protein